MELQFYPPLVYAAFMQLSRRDLSLLLPALAAAQAPAAGTPLPSKTFNFDDLPVKINGKNKSRAVLNGDTHSGFPIEMHMTELGPGEAPHPPHHHVHEEMLLLKEGTMEVTISGKVTKIGPGSSVYVASNEEHGWRNAGTTSALYFVIALGREA
jgi:quercetin dioxygenase-like cupin family protein